MKSKIYTRILSILMTAGLTIALAGTAKSQVYNVGTLVPDTVGVWGPSANIELAGQPCAVRLRVIKHYGTTCVFDVEIRNHGTRTVSGTFGFMGRDNKDLYATTAGGFEVEPGKAYYWKREKREVLKRGVKNDALACRNCNPALGFYRPVAR